MTTQQWILVFAGKESGTPAGVCVFCTFISPSSDPQREDVTSRQTPSCKRGGRRQIAKIEVSYKRSIVWPLFHLQGYLQILQNFGSGRTGIFMVNVVGRLRSLLPDEHFSGSKSITRGKNGSVHDLVSKGV